MLAIHGEADLGDVPGQCHPGDLADRDAGDVHIVARVDPAGVAEIRLVLLALREEGSPV